MRTHEPVYDGANLTEKMAALPKWTAKDGWLRREIETDGWKSTMLVVNAIAFVAEAANHHPDMEVHWGRVVVQLQTHSAGGVTDKDLQMAARIETTIEWHPSAGFPGLEPPPRTWIKE